MKKTCEEIQSDTILLLRELAGDWEYSGSISRNTYLLADLGFESLDVVILSAEMEAHYQQDLPFTAFFTEIGQRERKDVSVGEWVDFIYQNVNVRVA